VPETTRVSFSSVFLDRDSPNDARIDELAQWGKRFRELGMVQGAEGDLSFRTKLGFIITGSEATIGNLTRDTIVETRGVVFGLNRPSVYVKGQVTPSVETLLHSGIYEVLPEVSAIFHLHDSTILKVADELGFPSIDMEQPIDSQELVQEVVRLVKLDKSARYFVLKNHGVVALGTTVAEAGKLMEEMHDKAMGDRKRRSK
jgi:ribulose-5-phosphate 4-epimerase/fuculose-1-phosphate aldolase